jgi:2'-5' RNA ligase
MVNQYYRTFIALPVLVGGDLLELRHEMMIALKDERISWVDPKRFHVTLRFLGDTPLSEVDKIAKALKERENLPNAISVPVTGVGSFGPFKNPRVIWAGFSQEEWFNKLKEGVDDLLEEYGFPKQDQPFTAHLTLGRIRSLRNLSRYHEVIEGMKSRACDAVYFSSLVYYRSILGSGGPEYSKLEENVFRRK